MGTLSGEVTLSILICFPSQEGFTLKGKNLLLLEQILSFKSKSKFGRAMSAREVTKVVPLSKNDGKTWRFTHTP